MGKIWMLNPVEMIMNFKSHKYKYKIFNFLIFFLPLNLGSVSNIYPT